ncbi:MAG: hypothetical protein D6754_14125 [Alphaproteobacteria bacterium]|nr:MAG: hypothetical protein D6754_14125 [Alphaproteobacteria bacterium]
MAFASSPDGMKKSVCGRSGRDLSIVASSIMVHKALAAAETLAGDGIEAVRKLVAGAG